ncbi:nucleotidyltransferase domain-containing protein [uncultured Endozoicomonas sp.]|uniref:nucleotidyltransferase domain-containing protein n=1 Tax=uncultured Endozoicomonas sp. TaxID=432652 RepID=UPI00261F7C15|nr:nucleotidyltransferase domain-containing protein [uncultured Endozoicomonas sp.]
MRLTQQEQQVIKDTVKVYDQGARVYLFGSRADADKKGGDIDLLVISEKLDFTHKLNILADLHQHLGEQKIDILIEPPDRLSDFAATIFPEAIEL